MSIVQRCHFRLTGEEKFDRFVAKLRDFMDELWKTFSAAHAKNIERSLLQQVAENNDIAVLKQISKIYGEEAGKRRKYGQRHQGYDLVRELADFKAEVQDLSLRRARDTLKRKLSGMTSHCLLSANILDPQELTYNQPTQRNWPFADGNATLAVKKNGGTARYIEWKSYADGGDGSGGHDSEFENELMELADLFGIKKRPNAFRVLPFEGIFRSKRELRFGFVFQPPSYIEKIDYENKPQDGVSRPRKPHTLHEHVKGGAGTLSLGDRFRVARKLAGSLYAMHAAGWVHKKPGGHSGGHHVGRSGDQNNVLRFHENIKLDFYHHPAEQDKQSLRYRQAFDLYSSVSI
ncbi:MAG: hypothetical protein Q9207_006402 [Kuettlingeria erythrocarpa]